MKQNTRNPKIEDLNPKIFLTTKQSLKWKTHLWLIIPKTRENSNSVSKNLKKITFDDERRRYGSSSVYLKVLGRCVSGFCSQVMNRETVGLRANEKKKVLGRWVSGSANQDMKRKTKMFENRRSSYFRWGRKMRNLWDFRLGQNETQAFREDGSQVWWKDGS